MSQNLNRLSESNKEKGFIAEKLAFEIMDRVIGKKRQTKRYPLITIESNINSGKPYLWGSGAEKEILKNRLNLYDIETLIKQRKEGKKPTIEQKTMQYRLRNGWKIVKVLFISNIEALSKKSIKLLEQLGIKIFEFGCQINNYNFKQTLKDFLTQNYLKLKQLLGIKPLKLKKNWQKYRKPKTTLATKLLKATLHLNSTRKREPNKQLTNKIFLNKQQENNSNIKILDLKSIIKLAKQIKQKEKG